MIEKMSNAPVYYALVQAHFNPVAAMATYVDRIQDLLRRQGYPLYEPQQTMQLVVPGAGQAQQEPQIQQAQSWLMTRSDRTAGFILGPSAITYHTTHYQTHQEFIPELLKGLSIVHTVASLDHVSRVGLRYLDAVLPRAGETAEQYLVGGLHGIDFKATRQHAMTESVFATDTGPLMSKGTLVVRVYRVVAPPGFPPDMIPAGLDIAPQFKSTEVREHAIIDTDHYVQGRMPVEMQKLHEQLRSLHSTIKSVFFATTTDHAHKAWA
ncbi:TIGR04255 family protein [Robbsia andropogonis]|uniref:TIGR04255 family protein n=1 Tax=Robbsia andropogonis TaxID=28092 RepID=UPI002A69D1DB|nr:TIGR04255 family protein [Robbsia andropogonis]